jgi:protoheme IX farnesyltransferase
MLLWPIAPTGVLYPIAALVLGVLFIIEAARLVRAPDRSMALFRYSTIYLAVLFAMIWVDTAIG